MVEIICLNNIGKSEIWKEKIFNGIKCDKGDHKVNKQKYLEKDFFQHNDLRWTTVKYKILVVYGRLNLNIMEFMLLVYLLITCVSLLKYKLCENRTCLLFTVLIWYLE